MNPEEVYLWTRTIKDWKALLKQDYGKVKYEQKLNFIHTNPLAEKMAYGLKGLKITNGLQQHFMKPVLIILAFNSLLLKVWLAE